MAKVTRMIDIPLSDSNEYKKYSFVRGFLLTPDDVSVHDCWNKTLLGVYHLTYDA